MKIKRYTWTVILIMFIVVFGIVTVNASANREKIEYLAEETEIHEVIHNYFDKRYRSRATNQIEDFRELTDNSPQSNSFILSETDKLEIEIYNAELHHLRYSQYEYFLDFSDISIDKDNQIATVSLVEGHDVIFEISEMIAKIDPIVSKMRNLEHTIVLKKTQDGWKILSDRYDDLLWRMIRANNLSKEDMLLILEDVQDRASISKGIDSAISFCNLPDDESTHPYNRSGAVAYAHRYAESPNPDYHYFTEDDCTNFVNQAIHHGSNAEAVGSNTYGWYYNYYNGYDDNDYSASWTDVQFLYDFITQYWVWPRPNIDDPDGPGGPEGCEINNDYAALDGDLVQFEWDGDTTWDHAVIIVRVEIPPDDPNYPYFYVSGHSDDMDDYPLDDIVYEDRRFIRIERIDGYAKVYLPLVIKNSGGRTSNQPRPTYPIPYPAPMERNEEPEAIDPYPAP